MELAPFVVTTPAMCAHTPDVAATVPIAVHEV